jgi:hypothetical protein
MDFPLFSALFRAFPRFSALFRAYCKVHRSINYLIMYHLIMSGKARKRVEKGGARDVGDGGPSRPRSRAWRPPPQ